MSPQKSSRRAHHVNNFPLLPFCPRVCLICCSVVNLYCPHFHTSEMADITLPIPAVTSQTLALDDDMISPMRDTCVSTSPLASPGYASSYFGISIDGDTLREVDTRRMSAWDKRDMKRLGRTQEMRRPYRTLSMLSFTVVVQATWEFVLV